MSRYEVRSARTKSVNPRRILAFPHANRAQQQVGHRRVSLISVIHASTRCRLHTRNTRVREQSATLCISKIGKHLEMHHPLVPMAIAGSLTRRSEEKRGDCSGKSLSRSKRESDGHANGPVRNQRGMQHLASGPPKQRDSLQRCLKGHVAGSLRHADHND